MNKEHKPYLAFGNQWFAKYQIILIVLLHFPVVGNLFRYILGIKTLLPILKITGSYFVEFKGLTKRRLVSYSGLVFSMAIYKAFKPYWWMLHYIDEFLAYCKVPEQFSFGFSTLTVYPDANPETSTWDGCVYRTVTSKSFSTIRNSGGNAGSDNRTDDEVGGAFNVKSSTTTNEFVYILRNIYLFDTSSIGSATKSVASLFLYSCGKSNGLGSPDFCITGCTTSSNTGKTNSDYESFGTTSFSRKTYADFDTGAYREFVFDSNGIAYVNGLGITKLMRRSGWDFDNSFTGTWSSSKSSGIMCYAAEAGTSYAPKLVVTYSSSAIKKHIGTAVASIKKHITTITADAKKHIEVT